LWKTSHQPPSPTKAHPPSKKGQLAPNKIEPNQIGSSGLGERLLTRLEKRIEALQRVKLDGFQMVISELEVEMDYLRGAKRHLEEGAAPYGVFSL